MSLGQQAVLESVTIKPGGWYVWEAQKPRACMPLGAIRHALELISATSEPVT